MITENDHPIQERILAVDLTTEHVAHRELDETMLRTYVGGAALGARILYDEIRPGTRFDDPANHFVVLAGIGTGTTLPGCGGFNVSTVGALTGGAASSQAQGVFGTFLRSCGIFGLDIHGACRQWCYLLITDNGHAELRDARALLGLDTWETVNAIETELNTEPDSLSVLCIGPAGENLVRFANVMADRSHTAAHNGVGAVLGSKRLKAVVVCRGTHRVQIRNRDEMKRVVKGLLQRLTSDKEGTYYYGTLIGTLSNYAVGQLPIKNYTTNEWDVTEAEFRTFAPQYIVDHFQTARGRKCWACGARHCEQMTIAEGPYKGQIVEEPEYEQISSLGPNLGIKDINAIMMLANHVDRLGLDTNETGWVVGLVIEAVERGLLGEDACVPSDLTWGNVEAVKALTTQIANRTGTGDVLAEGVKRAVEHFGPEVADIGIYVLKGSTPRSHDHRGRWAELFDHCVSDSGALDGGATMTADLAQFGLPEKIDTFSPQAIASAETLTKGGMLFEDSVITCRLNTKVDVRSLAAAVAAITGWEFTFEEAMNVGRRACNLMRAFNLRSGITADLDKPSKRYSSTPTNGPAAGKAIGPHYDEMRLQYYAGMGWTVEGVPQPETLRKLGLGDVATDLWGADA